MSTPVTNQPLKSGNPAFQKFEIDEFSSGKWNQEGICDAFCGDKPDCATCWITSCAPEATYGLVQEKLGNGTCGSMGCLFFCCKLFFFPQCLVIGQRNSLRKQHNIDGNACNDCLIGCFCTSCALCQHARQYRVYE